MKDKKRSRLSISSLLLAITPIATLCILMILSVFISNRQAGWVLICVIMFLLGWATPAVAGLITSILSIIVILKKSPILNGIGFAVAALILCLMEVTLALYLGLNFGGFD